jgi:hypothetical protein
MSTDKLPRIELHFGPGLGPTSYVLADDGDVLSTYADGSTDRCDKHVWGVFLRAIAECLGAASEAAPARVEPAPARAPAQAPAQPVCETAPSPAPLCTPVHIPVSWQLLADLSRAFHLTRPGLLIPAFVMGTSAAHELLGWDRGGATPDGVPAVLGHLVVSMDMPEDMVVAVSMDEAAELVRRGEIKAMADNFRQRRRGSEGAGARVGPDAADALARLLGSSVFVHGMNMPLNKALDTLDDDFIKEGRHCDQTIMDLRDSLADVRDALREACK